MFGKKNKKTPPKAAAKPTSKPAAKNKPQVRKPAASGVSGTAGKTPKGSCRKCGTTKQKWKDNFMASGKVCVPCYDKREKEKATAPPRSLFNKPAPAKAPPKPKAPANPKSPPKPPAASKKPLPPAMQYYSSAPKAAKRQTNKFRGADETYLTKKRNIAVRKVTSDRSGRITSDKTRYYKGTRANIAAAESIHGPLHKRK